MPGVLTHHPNLSTHDPAGVVNVRLAVPPTLRAPYGGLLASSYIAAVARAKSSAAGSKGTILEAFVTDSAEM